MAEKRVSVRLGVIGGKEVEATFENLGNRGGAAMRRLGDQSEEAFARVDRGSRRGGGGLQNLGFQVQDFAVQLGNGTSASVALSQQLPQLLGGFGALGAVIGAVVAIGIPLAAYFLGINTNAKSADEAVRDLADSIGRLKDQQATYSTEGIQAYIEKYGELNAEVLLLIQRQNQFAANDALQNAKTAVAAFQDEITGGFWSGLVNSDPEEIANALGVGQTIGESLRMGVISETDKIAVDYQALLNRIESMRASGNTEGMWAAQEELATLLGTLNPMVNDFSMALDAASAAGSFEEQADAVARLSSLIQGTALEGTAFAGTLLDAESALRELNAEGGAVGGWLGAAIDWASSLAGNLWDGAAAAAAIRDAQARPVLELPALAGPAGMTGGTARDHQLADAAIAAEEFRNRRFNRPDMPRGGGGGGGGGSATSDLEREAARIYESTRTQAELYATELARLNEIKAAGLITGDTYNRQLEALGERYKTEGDGIKSIQTKLEDFVKSSAKIADGIGGALVDAFNAGGDAVAEFVRTGKLDMTGLVTSFIADMARLAAQKFMLAPIADLLSGLLGGSSAKGSFGIRIPGQIANLLPGGGNIIQRALAGILHDGGVVGSAGGARSVDASVFGGARRMHGGGVAGLAGDEVPAILQKGERVLSKQQNAAYERGGSPTIIFNVKDAASVRQSRSQIAADAARAVAMGRRNS